MSSKPAVSVIIPTFHRNELLRAALESVSNQEYDGSIDAVVVDSSEKPHARPVVDEFDCARYHRQVEYFPRHEDGTHNISRARDVGMAFAQGEYIQFLDDDDELHPAAITKKITAVEDHFAARGCYTAIEKPDGTFEGVPPDVQGQELRHLMKTLTSPATPSTILVETSVLECCPPQRTLPHNDNAQLIEILLRTPLVYLDSALTIQNKTSSSIGFSSASQYGRLRTAEKYSGLRTKLLAPAEKTEARRNFELLVMFVNGLENLECNLD